MQIMSLGIHSGASLQGTCWGQLGLLSLMQWSLSTRDKLGTGLLSLMQWSLSTRDKLGTGLLSLMQWSLSTRDKLGTDLLSLMQWSLSTRDKLGTGLDCPLHRGTVPIMEITTCPLFRSRAKLNCPLFRVSTVYRRLISTILL